MLGWALNLGFAGSGSVATAPVFSGTIADISVREKSGTYTYDFSSYFSNSPTSYSISPAVPSGYSFDTSTCILIVDSKYKGEFGPFTITATNAGGSDSSNAFGVSTFAGAATKANKPKPKQVMIDGQRYVVNTQEEEFFLLQAHLNKKRNQYEADILKKKTPQVKKNIKLLSSQVTRIENRLTKVEEQLKWRQKIKRNNQIILALLAA